MRDKWNVKKERVFENTYSSGYKEQENPFDEGYLMASMFMIVKRYRNWLKIL